MSQQNNTESSAATTAATQPSVPAYNLLGSSGLRVFPLCLGTMGFGQNPITKTFVSLKSFEYFINLSFVGYWWK